MYMHITDYFCMGKMDHSFFHNISNKTFESAKILLKNNTNVNQCRKILSESLSFFPLFTVIWNLQYVCFHDVVIKTWLSLVYVDQLPVGQRKKSYFPLKIMCSAKLDFHILLSLTGQDQIIIFSIQSCKKRGEYFNTDKIKNYHLLRLAKSVPFLSLNESLIRFLEKKKKQKYLYWSYICSVSYWRPELIAKYIYNM